MNPAAALIFIPPVQARCGLCGQVSVCAMGERELEIYLCSDCLTPVLEADAALAAAGYARPPRGVAFTQRNT